MLSILHFIIFSVRSILQGSVSVIFAQILMKSPDPPQHPFEPWIGLKTPFALIMIIAFELRCQVIVFMLYDECTYFIFLKIKRYLCVCVEEIDAFDPDRRF
jgi:hypothetical protein